MRAVDRELRRGGEAVFATCIIAGDPTGRRRRGGRSEIIQQ